MKYVDIARSPGSAIRVFTSSERLANQLKISVIGEVGEVVTKTEMGDPRIRKLVKKNEMDVPKVGKKRSWKIGEEESRWVVQKQEN